MFIPWLKRNKKIVFTFFLLLIIIYPDYAQAGVVGNVVGWAAGGILDMLTGVVTWIGNLILGLFSLVLVVVGWIFDLSIYLSIVNIKDFFTLPAIQLGWAMMRDAINVIFIFILFWYAFQLVAGLGKIDAKAVIVKLVMIAIVVNFSGVIVRLVVDASNVVAVQFYRQITNGGNVEFSGSTLASGQIMKFNGVAQKLRNGLDLGRIATPLVQQAETQPASISDPSSKLTGGTTFFGAIAAIFWGVIMIIVTSFVLLVASALFIFRTVYLVFLYIIAPLMIGLQLLPQFQSHFNEWKRDLINQAIFAPVFLFFLMIVLLIIEKGGVGSLIKQTGDKLGASAFYGGIVITSFSFIILITMLLLTIVSAKKLSAGGMEMAMKGATWGTARLTTAALGAGLQLGRWGGRKIGEKYGATFGPSPWLAGAGKWTGDRWRGAKGLTNRGRLKLAETQALGLNALGRTGVTSTMSNLAGGLKLTSPLAGLSGKGGLEESVRKKAKETMDTTVKAAIQERDSNEAYRQHQKALGDEKRLSSIQARTTEENRALKEAQSVIGYTQEEAARMEQKAKDAAATPMNISNQFKDGAKDIPKNLLTDSAIIDNMGGKVLQSVFKDTQLKASEGNKILSRIEMGMGRRDAQQMAQNSILIKSFNRSAQDKNKLEELMSDIAKLKENQAQSGAGEPTQKPVSEPPGV